MCDEKESVAVGVYLVLERFEQDTVRFKVARVVVKGCGLEEKGSGGEQITGGVAWAVGIGHVVVPLFVEASHDTRRVEH